MVLYNIWIFIQRSHHVYITVSLNSDWRDVWRLSTAAFHPKHSNLLHEVKKLLFFLPCPSPPRTEPVPVLHSPPKESLLPNVITSKHPKCRFWPLYIFCHQWKGLGSTIFVAASNYLHSVVRPYLPPARVRIPNSINFFRQVVPCLIAHTIWQSANLSTVLLNMKPKTASKLPVPLVLSRWKRWFVLINWLYFYSLGPWGHCETQLALPRLNLLIILLPAWKCVLFIEICNSPIDTVLRIFLTKVLPLISQPSTFNDVCKLSCSLYIF